MKKWKILVGVALAILILAAAPLSVMAAGNNKPAARQGARAQLAIVHPRVVAVGQKMQLTVLARLNQKAVGGAEVWAVKQNNFDNVKSAVQALTKQGADNVTYQDYINILAANGFKLGQTRPNGKLTYSFSEAGNFGLVAFKPGFRTGFSVLAVRNELTIQVVKKATAGATVTVTVNQKGTKLAENETQVWAAPFSNIQSLKSKLAQVVKDNQGNPVNVNWSTELAGLAKLVGTTADNGQVTYLFEQGRFILIAVKKGFLPAYAPIVITAPQTSP